MKKTIIQGNRLTIAAGVVILGAAAASAERALSPSKGPMMSVPSQAPVQSENPFSLAGGALTIDIEARLRGEYRSNNYDFKGSNKDVTDDKWLLSRARIGALIKACPGFKMYVQAQDSREFGSDRAKIPGSADGAEGNDAFDLRQAWVEFGDVKDHPLTLKLGRQTLQYGDERLIGASEWNNLSRTFDAAKLRWEEKNWSLDLFAASEVDVSDVRQFNQSDFLNGREKRGLETDKVRSGQLFSGLYGSTGAFGPQTTDLYVLHLHEHWAPGDTNFFTYGTRMKSKPGAFSSAVDADGKKRALGVDYSGEFAFQSGSVKGKDLRAFALNGGLGYTLDQPWTPRLGVAYSYATGDKNGGDGKVGTFQNLFPTNHKFYGQLDAFSWQNMHDLELNFKVTPVKAVTLKSELHAFWLANTNDNWYRANKKAATFGAPSASVHPSAGGYAGSEADFTATWAVSKPFSVEAGYSRFFAGSYLKDTGSRSDANFGYLQAKLTF
jgi:hypothetical protein